MQYADGSLSSLAEAVADGSSVDWEDAEASATDPEERVVVQQLRLLATIGQAAKPPAWTWGPLEIRSEVGSGTFGTVYRAWDARLEREVALKLLNAVQPEADHHATAVVKEGRLLAQIRHPNVVTVYGADCFDGRVGIWMEFVQGRTLREIQRESGPLSPQEAALVGLDLCRALAAVHAAGFLHRDVKAQNVMRESGGRIVLMDFGAGEVANPADADSKLIGTPVYIAPEVIAGQRHTPQSDLYGLGVLLFYLVTGQFPMVASSVAELREKHAANQRIRLRDVRPDLPPAFIRVVDSVIAADPAERPASAGALEEALEDALGLRTRAVDGGRAESRDADEHAAVGRGSAPRRNRIAAVALAVLTLAAAAGALLMKSPWRPSPSPRSSVAVLPFKNLTADPENEYFSTGITDDIAAHLATIGELRVISGTSVVHYKDRGKSATEIGSELGVATVLDGSVRRSGDRVRIFSQLVDARTGDQVWSESYDREVQDIFSIQSEVSRKIAIALKGELSASEAERLGVRHGQSFEAFNLYLKGRSYWNLRTEDGFNRSIQYFEDALKRDSNYAPAYAGLADTYTLLGAYGTLPRADAASHARAAAEKAVELDDSLAEAHASLGLIRKNAFEWDGAEASFKKALQLKPGYATGHHWYAAYLAQRGRFADAIAEIKTAVSLDPLSASANGEFAAILLLARRYDDAITQALRTLKMDPAYSLAYQDMAEAYAYQGKYDRALDEAYKAEKTGGLGLQDQELRADIAYILAKSGRRNEALKIANALIERTESQGDVVAANVATIYAALGETNLAFEWLKRALTVRDPGLGYLKVDPRWDPLRGDERFGALLASLGLAK
jgi:TolB-like protein/tetratricopeptide (TPR) repeat protein